MAEDDTFFYNIQKHYTNSTFKELLSQKIHLQITIRTFLLTQLNFKLQYVDYKM